MGKQDELSLDQLVAEAHLYDNPLTEKQKDILKAAETLFSQHGYSDTPTAEIARRAGVTEKTLFKHFPTKSDLLKRVMFPLLLRIIVPTQIKHMKTLIQNSGNSPKETFKAILTDRMNLVSQFQGKIKFLLQELLRNEDLRTQASKLWHEQLWVEFVRIIDAMKESGQVRKDVDSAIAARAMVSLAVSYLLSSQLFPNKWNHKDNIDKLSEILVKGIS